MLVFEIYHFELLTNSHMLIHTYRMNRNPHGSFAFKFVDNYTLISVAGSWNTECVEIYNTLLKKRVESKPEQRRCVIFDGRKWGFQTPECYNKFLELNQYISGHYKALFIAYYLAPENFSLSTHLLDMANDEFKGTLNWRFFLNLQDVASWLNSEGFEIPALTNSDFPEPISANHYLDYL
ncbi:MAG: hypothetical protein KKC20_09690 [Proteobacteria bacterium]|nr:hypothetical protein [Pseudomonadota bacterium]